MGKLPESGSAGQDESKSADGRVATSLEDLGNFCLATGEFKTAIEYFNKLLPILGKSEKAKPLRGSLLRRLATCYRKIGRCDHALELLDKAFMLVSNGEEPLVLARIIAERAQVHFKIGEYDLSQADCESAIDILLGEDKGKEIATAYNLLGAILYRKGEIERAMDFYRAALSAARLINDRELMGICLNNLGLVSKSLGRYSQSQAYLEEALKIAEEIGQHLRKAVWLNNLGIVYSKRGLWRRAHKCWTESLQILTTIGNRWEVTSVYLALGHYYLTYRDFERAEEYYIRAMKESADNGDTRTSALSFESMGDVHFACGCIESAHRCYLEALEIAEEIAPAGDIVSEVKRRLADLEAERGNYEVAVELATEGLQIANSIRDVTEQACSLRSRGCAEYHLGEWEKAKADLDRSIDLLSSLGEKKELAMTYLSAGRLLGTNPSSYDIAGRHLSEALSIFEDLGMMHEAGVSALEISRIDAMNGDIGKCRGLLDRVKEIFNGDVPKAIRQEIAGIRRKADERISYLSVDEDSNLASFNAVLSSLLQVGGETQKLEVILQACIDETAAERGLILIESAEDPKAVASADIAEDERRALVAFVSEVMEHAAKSGKPVVSTNVDADERFSAGRDVAKGAVMCVPLALGGGTSGCIYLDTSVQGKFFNRKEVEFAVALTGILNSVLSEAKLARFVKETRFLRTKLQTTHQFQGMITQNRKILQILDAVRFLEKTSTTILIEGETGTGKEMLARAIHNSGDRQSRPFVTIDCSALSNEILESELFGHIKGAFTDARVNKTGLFEAADGGTVFLDEIDKTSRKFQDRLLQVVDKREFKPVGSTVSRKIDFRLICATNRDLCREVESGRFLEDLYYRLKVISLKLPPLRERRDDIPLLAEHFLNIYNERLGKAVVGFSASAMDLLVSFSWAGNVRQLEHEVERAVTFAEDGEIVTPDLFSDELRDWGSIVSTDSSKPMAEAVKQVEKQMIKEAMRRFGGNKSKAAKSLGLSRRGLLNKLQRYRITL
jgi:Nif-specific regulatory protein